MLEHGGTDVELSAHAARRMALRGISREQVDQIISSIEPFQYHQSGVAHLGYFDPTLRLFVAVVNNTIVTAFFSRASYVEGLRRRTT